jgi:NAD(P)H-nitrite reductase large subunit
VDLDDPVCFCFRVSKRKIVRFLERERPARASQVSECLSAGTGCGWCVPYLRRLHREVLTPSEVREAADVSAADYEALRRAYLATGVRPLGLGLEEDDP